jgi:hypothetical protein
MVLPPGNLRGSSKIAKNIVTTKHIEIGSPQSKMAAINI